MHGDAHHPALRARLRTLAQERVRWGYRRLAVLLRREGFQVNHKLVHRLYREEGLAVRRKRRKRTAVARVPLPVSAAANEHWSLDFVSDALADGRKFRCLTLVDQFTRECPVIEVDTSLPGERVVRVLDRVIAERGTPRVITIDNGPELAGKALDAWGLSARRTPRLYPAWQAGGERVHRELQRQVPRRMPGSALVPAPR